MYKAQLRTTHERKQKKRNCCLLKMSSFTFYIYMYVIAITYAWLLFSFLFRFFAALSLTRSFSGFAFVVFANDMNAKQWKTVSDIKFTITNVVTHISLVLQYIFKTEILYKQVNEHKNDDDDDSTKKKNCMWNTLE